MKFHPNSLNNVNLGGTCTGKVVFTIIIVVFTIDKTGEMWQEAGEDS